MTEIGWWRGRFDNGGLSDFWGGAQRLQSVLLRWRPPKAPKAPPPWRKCGTSLPNDLTLYFLPVKRVSSTLHVNGAV